MQGYETRAMHRFLGFVAKALQTRALQDATPVLMNILHGTYTQHRQHHGSNPVSTGHREPTPVQGGWTAITDYRRACSSTPDPFKVLVYWIRVPLCITSHSWCCPALPYSRLQEQAKKALAIIGFAKGSRIMKRHIRVTIRSGFRVL